jgi:hypothetical protein
LQTFGIGPSNARGVDQRPAFVYVGGPGTVIRDRFALLNYSFKPVKVKVYATDAFTNRTGAFDVLPAVEKPTDLGAWTNLQPRTITLPARSRAQAAPPRQVIVPFTVRVPKGAAPGDHAAGIVASTSTRPVRGDVNAVIVDRRVGTRIYLRVPGTLDARLEVQDLRADYQQNWNPAGPGATRVSYRIVNTGNVALSAVQRVRVDGLIGTSASSPPLPDAIQVLPGDSIDVSTVVAGVWPTVRGTAVVELDPYATTVGGTDAFPTVTASTPVWLLPWPQLIALAILIALGWAYRRWRAWRSGRNVNEPSPDLETPELVNA